MTGTAPAPGSGPLRVGVVGCGDIARTYATAIAGHEELELVGATDRNPGRTAEITDRFGGTPHKDLDGLLADDAVEVVVTLTRHYSHAELTRAALTAGKHVFSEKPLAMTSAQARDLVSGAAAAGLRLGCAPATFLGEAQQTAWAALRTGLLGPIRVVFADVNWGQIERWHPRPQDFYAAGALFDVGVYPLTVLTSFLGPVRSVTAMAAILKPGRYTVDGTEFILDAPDFSVGLLTLESGALIRLTCGFYVDMVSRQRGIEIHGDDGSLLMDRWYEFDAGIHLARRGGTAVRLPLLGAPPDVPVDYGRGLVDLAQAIRDGRPHRATGEQAAHIVEVVEAMLASASEGRPVAVTSGFTPPAPGAPGLQIQPDEENRRQLADVLDQQP